MKRFGKGNKREYQMKRDKYIHSSKIRSVAKKGGRGAYAWGAPGDELDVPPMDKEDPCYESEEVRHTHTYSHTHTITQTPSPTQEDNYILISREEENADAARRAGIKSQRQRDGASKNMYTRSRTRSNDSLIPPKMKLTDFKKRIVSILREYFVSEDTSDAADSLKRLDCPAFHYEFVKRAITMSIDRKDREREAVSILLSSMYPSTLSSVQIGKGFERLFERADDLELDAPNLAKDVITKFLCRAVTDEILPPSFLTDPFVESLGGGVVDNAKTILTQKHSFARLERVWGVSTNQASVNEIKRTYFVSVSHTLNYIITNENRYNATHRGGISCGRR
jgi:programmed cell death protein 4